MKPLFYLFNRASISLLILLLLGALTFQSHAQSSSVTTTQSFSYTGQIVTYTVPSGVTSLTVEARGAEGGYSPNSSVTAGKGAIISGLISVSAGQQLKILVGQKSPQQNGGGGGSFITDINNNPLLIAGGGGGSGNINENSAKDGQAATNGGSGAGSTGSQGGTGGNGGTGNQYGGGGGGGGGLLTDGTTTNSATPGGKAFTGGGAGGGDGRAGSGIGGFGGGGAGSGNSVGGGGGGYSGGGSGYSGASDDGPGGGGGSFNAGTNQTNTAGANSGNGLVTITYVLSPQPIRYVKQGGMGNGTSWDNASGDLQSQIDMAGADQVWVAAGRYTTTANNGSFSLKNGVAVYGGFVGNETNIVRRQNVNPITGTPSSTTLTVNSGGSVVYNTRIDQTAILDGVVITGGSGGFGGGGISNRNSSPTLTNCLISGNTAHSGGGIFNFDSSSPSLTGCLIQGNTAENAGGGFTTVATLGSAAIPA